MNKFGNKKTLIDGILFASKSEAEMYLVLKSLQEQGKIRKLELQPAYTLQPSFLLNGKRVRAIKYIADFKFYDCEQGRTRVIDCKGFKTKVYRLKRKMFDYKFRGTGIYLEEQV